MISQEEINAEIRDIMYGATKPPCDVSDMFTIKSNIVYQMFQACESAGIGYHEFLERCVVKLSQAHEKSLNDLRKVIANSPISAQELLHP